MGGIESGSLGSLSHQGRLQHCVPSSSTPVGTSGSQVGIKPVKEHSHRGTDSTFVAKGSIRRGDGEGLSRILLKAFPGTQAKQQMETSDRFEHSQQDDLHPQVQDGHATVDQTGSSKRLVGVQSGPEGCVLSDPNPSKFQEIPKTGIPGENLPIQGSTLRHLHSPLAIHQSSQSGKGSLSSDGQKTLSVSGRLAWRRPRPVQCTSKISEPSRTVSSPGLCGELREIRPQSHSTLRLCGNPLQSPNRDGLRDSEELGEGDGDHFPSPINRSAFSTLVVSDDWYPDITGVAHAVWKAAQKTSPMVSRRPVVPSQGPYVESEKGKRLHQTPYTMVEQQGQSSVRGTSPPTGILSPHLHRRFTGGLGSTCQGQAISRSLVPRGISASHQHSGAQGCHSHSQRNPARSRGSNPDCHRQSDRSLLHQQSRRDSVSQSVEGDSDTFQGVSTCVAKSKAHPRETKCHCGSTIQTGTDSLYRVDSKDGSSSSSLRQMGDSSCGPLCDKTQQEMSDLCISSTRQHSPGSGRSGNHLGEHVRIRLSASEDPHTSSDQVPTNQELQNDSHRSQMAKTTVVSDPPATGKRRSSSSTTTKRSSKSTKVRHSS